MSSTGRSIYCDLHIWYHTIDTSFCYKWYNIIYHIDPTIGSMYWSAGRCRIISTKNRSIQKQIPAVAVQRPWLKNTACICVDEPRSYISIDCAHSACRDPGAMSGSVGSEPNYAIEIGEICLPAHTAATLTCSRSLRTVHRAIHGTRCEKIYVQSCE